MTARFKLRPTARLAGLALGALVGLTAQSAAADVSQRTSPQTGPGATADYRYLTLENGLGALLISDPRADKAAAALDVHVGAGADPEDRAGLAHFTEHMLFLGTETYPDPGEYKSFINSHGGSHNAFTSSLDTNYFFNVEPEFLEPALDRFSEQFRVPTFAAELIERERNAVNSEFSAHQRNDGRRFWSALKQTFPEGHPLAGFTVGNLDTLSNEDGELRAETVEFYEQHYSANLMELVVIGPQPLDELESMVVPRFSPVANRGHDAPRYTQPFLAGSQMPRLLEVDAIRDTRQLQLTFPIPSTEEDYRNKPLSYLSHLIGHEGQGSLHAVLKEAGLVDKLSAGQSMDTGDQAMMNISMSLTPDGRDQWREVVRLTFDYLDLIRENGIRQVYFEEQQKLNDIELRFRERDKPIHEASSLASRLHRVAPDDVVIAPWLYETYEPSVYRELMSHLQPDNVLVSLLAPVEETDDWQTTPYYDTPYRLTDLEAEQLVGGSERSAQLALPEPNPFIPEDLSLVSGEDMPRPRAMGGNGPLELWYARDTRFEAPRANVYLSLRSPAATGSARNAVLTRLLAETVRDELNALAYPARIAGLDYQVYSHLRGITVKLSGYSDKLPRLMGDVLERVRHPELDPESIRTRLQQIRDDLANAAERPPYKIASGAIHEQLLANVYSHATRLEAAGDLSPEDLEAHTASFYSALDPVMLVHGNMTRAAALNIRSRVTSLIMEDVEPTDVPRAHVRKLAAEEQSLDVSVRHSDQGYLRYIQGADSHYATQARFRLLAQLLSSPFYERLRTNQQMGYIVQGTYYPMLEAPGIGFIVQSPRHSFKRIDESVTTFLKEQEKRLANLDPERLERQKQAVVSRLAQDDTRLSQVANRYWQEIDRGNHDFDNREQLIKAVKAIDHEALMATYRNAVLEDPRALVINAHRDVPREAESLQGLDYDGSFPRTVTGTE
ncbi:MULTISPECIES: insulinase family protein [Halomonadaceae]|uniref:Protease 3 n=1 Tax=Vreelandella halophila TaxID=86177 RepID=A0A9X5B561_9GAMM|nr:MULTISPECIES: insulinase family protein [Halomonas]MYL27055.1 peptidase M16 [Halomonas utahensis]MYL75857.1 peptidase M16 [Halomonas sp. 22501_18_FS]